MVTNDRGIKEHNMTSHDIHIHQIAKQNELRQNVRRLLGEHCAGRFCPWQSQIRPPDAIKSKTRRAATERTRIGKHCTGRIVDGQVKYDRQMQSTVHVSLIVTCLIVSKNNQN